MEFLFRNSPLMNTPLLAITAGDPSGTGPELLTLALSDPEIRALCRPIIVGDASIFERARAITSCQLPIRTIRGPEDATHEPGLIEIIDLQLSTPDQIPFARVTAAAGRAATCYVQHAATLALENRVSGIVTSALNKEAMNLAGYHFDGHTGLLADICQRPAATMMLVADRLRVSHVSTHVSLSEAIARVRPERILETLRLTHDALIRLGIPSPTIAVAGLNPHAGENGLFGMEEIEHIIPAIEAARQEGIDAMGPFAGDTVFFRAQQGDFDAAVAMYHDQGHVAAKMLGIWLGVNVTLGLPFVRTSVEHGTDFAHAGTGKGDPRSLCAAIKLAVALSAS